MSQDKKSSNFNILVIATSDYLHRLEANQFNLFTQKLHNSIYKSIKQFEGKILSQNDNTYSVSFDSITNIVLCALKIQSNFKYITPKFDTSIRKLKIGIATGNDSSVALLLATRMCELVSDQIVITHDVRALYKSENRNIFINKDHIKTLNSKEVLFLTNLMNYIETIWDNPEFSIDQLNEPLGYSSSQVYRKMVSLTGKSPSTFIRDYRLNKALDLLHKRKGTIGEIAQFTGFKSATYFSKCFKDKFDILPSKYAQQHAS
jgi:AraC-like DNA-binding protein